MFKSKKFTIFFVCLLAVIFFSIYSLINRKNLPIITPRDVNPELVDTLVQHIGYNHKIAPFSFVNQNGKVITNKDYEGKIYVADFFFTTCQTICPKMTRNMAWLQDKIKDNPKVKLLSHSVFPHEDTVEVLKKYAKEQGVIDSKWNLVTGNQQDIYKIARQSYLVVKTGKPEEMYDMVHTENFVLVDQKGRIRGFYNGLNIDKEVKGEQNLTQLLEDIEYLSEKD
ncbi:SCO family protein [Flavobacterium urocaniciphilum]|uniref:Protein SCO1/2 n=1 Tax=Flavobacterium urocaniciphilum TaxID=1299341 RepID=A0A1H9BVX0_9FLAO|nr:SCO family protein [Flavobacterium urocaniciphilum]SEP92508.1 protein SCO1/2 [Flavobacterium urocaniciphilum]